MTELYNDFTVLDKNPPASKADISSASFTPGLSVGRVRLSVSDSQQGDMEKSSTSKQSQSMQHPLLSQFQPLQKSGESYIHPISSQQGQDDLYSNSLRMLATLVGTLKHVDSSQSSQLSSHASSFSDGHNASASTEAATDSWRQFEQDAMLQVNQHQQQNQEQEQYEQRRKQQQQQQQQREREQEQQRRQQEHTRQCQQQQQKQQSQQYQQQLQLQLQQQIHEHMMAQVHAQAQMSQSMPLPAHPAFYQQFAGPSTAADSVSQYGSLPGQPRDSSSSIHFQTLGGAEQSYGPYQLHNSTSSSLPAHSQQQHHPLPLSAQCSLPGSSQMGVQMHSFTSNPFTGEQLSQPITVTSSGYPAPYTGLMPQARQLPLDELAALCSERVQDLNPASLPYGQQMTMHSRHQASSTGSRCSSRQNDDDERRRKRPKMSDLPEDQRERLRESNRLAAQKHRNRIKTQHQKDESKLSLLQSKHDGLVSELQTLRIKARMLTEVVIGLYCGSDTRSPERTLPTQPA